MLDESLDVLETMLKDKRNERIERSLRTVLDKRDSEEGGKIGEEKL
jgi:hypothetical protein